MAIDYGTDFDCSDDFTEEFRLVSGITLIAQAIVRRYDTPRGMLLDDPSYGTDLKEYLDEDIDDTTLEQIRSDILGEPVKDERIKLVTVQSMTVTSGDKATDISLAIQLGVTLSDSTTFTMTISVSQVTVDLLEVQS